MAVNYPLLFSVGPFAVFILLLLWKKVPLLWSSLSLFLIILFLQAFYWKILPVFALNSTVKGSLVALDIFIIIFGAIFFLSVLQQTKIIENLTYRLRNIFKDYRVQVIILAWLFENFIEGTAGFGTPAAIVAPLLIGLGLPPLKACIIGLLGNSTSVVFGAAGTPIRVGFAGLDISSVPLYASLFNLVGVVVPVFMLWILTSNQQDRSKHFWEALPFAVWAGLVFVIPSVFFVGLGQEFPSILGSVAGLILILLTTRLGIFVPKNIRTLQELPQLAEKIPVWKIIFPYALLIILLVVMKLILSFVVISFPWGLSYTLNLFNPGWAFFLAGIPVAVIWSRGFILRNMAQAFKRTIEPFLVIVAMSASVQFMINSGNNLSGLPSSLEIIAAGFEITSLPFIAPFIGAFGSFITGSATVANIMFGSFLDQAAHVMAISPAAILALGVSGAAAGNMFALADVMAAETVVGLKNQTSQIVKGVLAPCLIYLLILAIIGQVIYG